VIHILIFYVVLQRIHICQYFVILADASLMLA